MPQHCHMSYFSQTLTVFLIYKKKFKMFYSGDPNIGHPNTENIAKPNFYLSDNVIIVIQTAFVYMLPPCQFYNNGFITYLRKLTYLTLGLI